MNILDKLLAKKASLQEKTDGHYQMIYDPNVVDFETVYDLPYEAGPIDYQMVSHKHIEDEDWDDVEDDTLDIDFDFDINDDESDFEDLDHSGYDKYTGIAEQSKLDELSKKTLGSYIKKSATSHADLLRKADKMAADMKPFKDFDKLDRKATKRTAGISRAVQRLTKEDSAFVDSGDSRLNVADVEKNKKQMNENVYDSLQKICKSSDGSVNFKDGGALKVTKQDAQKIFDYVSGLNSTAQAKMIELLDKSAATFMLVYGTAKKDIEK